MRAEDVRCLLFARLSDDWNHGYLLSVQHGVLLFLPKGNAFKALKIVSYLLK